MGIISIGGLTASTFLTLLVVPVVYTLVDDAGRVLQGLARRLWPKQVEPAATSPPRSFAPL